MAKNESAAPTIAVRLDFVDRPQVVADISARVSQAGGTVRTLSTVRRWTEADGSHLVEVELEVEGLAEDKVTAILDKLPGLARSTRGIAKKPRGRVPAAADRIAVRLLGLETGESAKGKRP